MVRFYLRNTLISPAILAGVIGLALVMIAGGDFADDLLYCYQYTVSIGIASVFIPVVTVLPVCYLQRQMNAGNVRYVCLIRSNCCSFSGGALLSAILSGMAVMLGAFLIFTAFCYFYCPSPYFGEGMGFYPSAFYGIFLQHPGFLYLIMGGIFILNGVIWPAISLLCFSFTSNQYVALAVPFIVRTGAGYLTQNFGWDYLDPSQLLLKGIASQLLGGGIPYVVLYSAVVVMICGIFWNGSVKRRLFHG